MARHGFGSGEQKYFAYPLPDLVSRLRTSPYAHLAPVANRWNRAIGSDARFPDRLEPFLERCHQAGQRRPTPLILVYGEGDYNCLRQDLYGEHVFPLQKRARTEVLPLGQGVAVVFAVNQRPSSSGRGIRKVAMRHGVSKVRSGVRHTAGIVFHDAL